MFPNAPPAGPLIWTDEYCGGAWLASSYSDVQACLRDPRLSVARAGTWVNSTGAQARTQLRSLKSILARSLLFTEGKRHRRLRQALAPGVARAALGQVEPFVRHCVDQSIDALSAQAKRRASFDFMEAIARPLPLRVISHLLGSDACERPELVVAAERVAHFIGEPVPSLAAARAAQQGAVLLVEYFERTANSNLAVAPAGAGALAALLDARQRGTLPARDMQVQCAMMLFAGYETTRNLLGNALHAFLEHPAQWDQVRRHPGRLRGAILEVLRWNSPVRYTARRVRASLEIGGARMERGQLVIAMIAAANRDPRRFSRPDEFHFDRDEGPPLSFGSGLHACIGAELSLIEAQTLFAGIAERLPGLHAGGSGVDWAENPVYRGPRRLEVCLAPGMHGPISPDVEPIPISSY